MARNEAPQSERESDLRHMAEDVFSSEKREDIWAIIIAVVVLLCSLAFPEQFHAFFSTFLYVI